VKIKLKELTLTNFCQFKKYNLKFKPGTIGLVGPNGAGKTNLIKGIYTALVGEPPAGHLKDTLRWGANFGYVELVMECDGHSIKVTRDLKKGTHTLTTDLLPEPLIKKETVNKWLSDIIGTSVSNLDTAVFVPQGLMTRMLTMRHADRAKLWCSLFGLDKAEKLSQLLLRTKTTLPVVRDVTNELTTLRETLQQLKGYKDNAHRDIEHIENTLELEREVYEDAKRNSYKETNETVAAQIEKATKRIETLRARQAELIKETEVELPTEADLEKRYMAGRNKANLEAKLQKALTDLANIEAELSKLVAPVRTAGLDQQVREAQVLRDDLGRTLAVRRKGTCSECGAKYFSTPEELNELEAKYKQAVRDFQALEEQRNKEESAARIYETTKYKLDCDKNSVTVLIASLQQDLLEFEDVEVLPQEEYTSMLNKIKIVTAYKQELNKVNMEIAQIQKELEYLNNNNNYITRDTKERALKFVEAYEAAKRKLESLYKVKTEVDVRYKITEESLTHIEAESERYLKLNKLISTIDRAREVLHQDNLPRLTISTLVDNFNSRIKLYEAIFGYNFTCKLTPDLDFVVDYPDYKDLPIDVLSGGEQMAAAASALMALHGMMAPELGLLVLDEPTYGLDKEAMTALATVLETACKYMKDKGMTILIPTHEEALLPIFDDVITLTKLKEVINL